MNKNQDKKNSPVLRLIISIFLVLVVVACYCFYNYEVEQKKTLGQVYDVLNGNNNEIIYCAEKSYSYKKDFSYLESLHYFAKLGISAFELENLSPESFNSLSASKTAENLEDSIYYFDLNWNSLGSLAKNELSLSEEELDKLIKEGQYYNSDFFYYALKTDSYYLILSRESAESESRKIDLLFPSDIPFYVRNVETGELTVNSIQGLNSSFEMKKSPIGLNFKKTDNNREVVKLSVNGEDNICAISYFELNGIKYEVGSIYDLGEFKTVVLYVPLMTGILLGIFAIMVYYAIYRLKTEACKRNICFHKIQICNIWTSDKNLIKNLISTVTVIGIVIVFYTIYFFASTKVLEYYAISDTALTNILSAAETYRKNSNQIYTESYSAGRNLANDVAEALLYDYDISKEDVLERLKEIIEANEITVYDRNGIIEYSTTKYKGYCLPKDDKNPRSKLWSILEGGTTDMSVGTDDDSLVDFAVRRQDDVGIVVLSLDFEEIESLVKKLSYSELIKFHDYDNIEQMYSHRSDPSKLYIVKDGSTVEISVNNNLPLNANGEYLFSVRKIQLRNYLINSLGSEDEVTMLGYSTSSIISGTLQFLFRTIVSYVLITVIVLLLLGQFNPETVETSDTLKDANEFFKEEAKKIRVQILPFSAIMAVLLFIGIRLYFGDISGIISAVDSMEKGLNILSVTSIMFYLGFSIGGISILSSLPKLIGKISNSKTVTLFSLLCSVFKTVIIVVFSVYSLKQLGVNTTAITAGIGLSGLAVGIGSKEIINDLVAGIFIIFEGQIQVGDFVTVDGFYGEIVCLGIRTTKIKRFHKELIINNSNLKNVINLSRGVSFAVLSFVFDSDTDLANLSQIVSQNQERINKAAGGLILGPLVDVGVEEVTDIGIKYVFGARVALESQRLRVQNRSRIEMIRIFTENGIKIARSNSLTVKQTEV